MAKLDVNDAHLTSPGHPDERKFLGVECPLTGRYFTYGYTAHLGLEILGPSSHLQQVGTRRGGHGSRDQSRDPAGRLS